MDTLDAKLNRLTKWRGWFAGWQLGTRPKGDPESDAVRDHREATILLRAELTALTGLLMRKGLITSKEFTQALAEEADALSEGYARRFPGVRATDEGITMDPVVMREHGTMKGWKP